VKEIKTTKRTAETVIPALENADDYQAFEAVVTADYHAETTQAATHGNPRLKQIICASSGRIVGRKRARWSFLVM
jgi:hypothetical protein